MFLLIMILLLTYLLGKILSLAFVNLGCISITILYLFAFVVALILMCLFTTFFTVVTIIAFIVYVVRKISRK